MVITKVILNDEHKQPITVVGFGAKFYWLFTEVKGLGINGPFASHEEAVKDAQEFCDKCAP